MSLVYDPPVIQWSTFFIHYIYSVVLLNEQNLDSKKTFHYFNEQEAACHLQAFKKEGSFFAVYWQRMTEIDLLFLGGPVHPASSNCNI